ncbi:mRNA cleavage and polyadenylation factor subunit [Exophiala xenobiotica]|uniref:mRNA cleavage and polyadenylation factor subunit n=1 Tax=Lithohypha guttulata TaxID=1690604 RepID=A0ABR0K066_9EURO|nr:mRNA cleavage and polyadenylation factor subunit [Lithohypha guttulata]KAK5311169.1 mRNA cleavage and polyadenylation factor subunit [Exophiala xenobiotica]
MQCYSELLPPSGVTNSVRASFTSDAATNLIVAKTSLLQIFDFVVSEGSEEVKLVLVAEFALQGTISALATVRPLKSKSGGDALLIAFRDAKLSLIEWDPTQHSISTISIHYYENHDLLLCPWSPHLKDCVSHLTIDPSSRCAAFNFNANSLAIIPFHQDNDDLAMDDGFDDLDDQNTDRSPTRQPNGDSHHEDKLYAPSFVLPMTALDPGLLHPIAMTFLHEYREPTIGVLYSTLAASMNMSPERRDVLAYAVYTLDIEQKASTTLLSVSKLPNDLQQVVAVPAPIGGTLLLGGNELIHIDQGGRANAIGVNEFSKQYSSFPMAYQSHLELRLEGSQVQRLDTSSNDMLLILADGLFVVLSFLVDGRSVSGLSLQKIDTSWTSNIFQARCSTITSLPQSHLFLGSEEADSVTITTARRTAQLKRITSRAFFDDTNGEISLEEEEEDDDDDLYADSKANRNNQQGSLEGSNIVLKSRLHSIAPLQDIALGRSQKRKREGNDEADTFAASIDRLELVASSNTGSNGSLAFLSRLLKPKVVKKFKRGHAQSVFALSSDTSELEEDVRPFDDMLVVADGAGSSNKQSSLLSLSPMIAEKEGNDFEKADRAVATGRLATGSHIVVYTRDIRAYNKDFGLDQIFAIVDEDTDATAEVVAATVTETHILALKSDGKITLLMTDKSGDLDEVDLPDTIPSEDVLSACIYEDNHDFFDTKRYNTKSPHRKVLILAVLDKQGSLSLHPVSNLNVQVFQYTGVDFLPPHLSPDLQIPKHWRNKDTLAEMTLCTLGPVAHGRPYLLLRNKSFDVTIYEPYPAPDVKGAYRFLKLSCHNGDPREAYNDRGEALSNASRPCVKPLHDVAGLGMAFVTGKYPSVIVKTDSSMPHGHRLDTGPVLDVSSFHDSSCNRGFIYANAENDLTFCEIGTKTILDFAHWAIEKEDVNEEVTGLTYYPRTGSYVLATSHAASFHLPRDDEWHPEWEQQYEKASTSFLPTSRAFSLKLISSGTHSVISQHYFEPDEQVLSVKCMNLEVSEQTHERKDLVVVGTGIMRGENVVTRGNLYLFDIVDVVPQPDIPETDLKLKLITKEDVRGAVTAISPIGTQGFVLAAQGQKCMVRGLREDNAILPVGFMDMHYYVSVAKELAGTGLTILADAFAGLWLMGYSEEPYKMQLLGRDLENPSVVAAEFLPQDKQLYIISSDGNGDLRILQYDPWNPKTERGSILLHRSTFNTGYLPTLMALLPRLPTPSEALVAATSAAPNESDSEDGMQVEIPALPTNHQVLIVTKEGAIALISPLAEQSYRRLSTLQTALTTHLEQPCGLNPRAHRQVETDGVGGRAMIDGEVVKRWLDQSSQHKYSLADRVGGTVWEVRSDLEAIGGAGLGFL